MSIISGRSKVSRLSNASILKKTSLKSRISEIVNTPTKVRFTLPHSKKVRSILEEYIFSKNKKDYEHLLCTIRDAELFEDDAISLLREANDCVSILNKKLKLFVEAIVSIKWLDYSKEVTTEYQSLIINLVSAHNEHARVVIDTLVHLFLEVPTEDEWPNGEPTSSDRARCIKIHTVVRSFMSALPMFTPLLISTVSAKYPYLRRPTHIQEYYLHNLLWMLEYLPAIKSEILYFIISKLVAMDVHAPRECLMDTGEDDEMFCMEIDERPKNTSGDKMIAHTLDVCLDRLYDHLINECLNLSTGELDWEATKNLYKDLITVFDNVLLSTFNISHVQFIMFFFCSFKQTFAETFLNHLWKKVCNPSLAVVFRQTAAVYIASFVARANYVPLMMLKGTLQEMSSWIHSYICNQDSFGHVNPDTRVHQVFYMVCQSLFYLVAFRHKELVTSKKNIVFLESLNLGKIVTSKLNPLRVCQSAVVQNFAAVTRKYQLAYCYTIMEHNARNVIPTMYQDEEMGQLMTCNDFLESYYPFDPYLLPRSGKKIYPLYRDYQESVDMPNSKSKEVKESEVDDFLETSPECSNSSKSLDKFSYGCSPGFKFKT